MKRLDPNHDLMRAARQTNQASSQIGLVALLDKLDMEIEFAELEYLAEQRALRTVAVVKHGYDIGYDLAADEAMARRIVNDPDWPEQRALLVPAYMDGILTGWQGARIRLTDRVADGSHRAHRPN